MLLPTLEQCLRRVATRHGHGFTDAYAIARWYSDFEGAQLPPRHVLDDDLSGPAATADAVLERFAEQTLLFQRPIDRQDR